MPEQTSADARATKRFFVNMLIRDITIDGAILDLIDNAVDAAPSNGGIEDSLIELLLEPDRFVIRDNCSGIDVDTARQYAFRFGRPDGFDPQTAIGEFGIGMKRAVFRLGEGFRVQSSTQTTKFVVDVDVKEWLGREDDWTFPMEIADAPDTGTGTMVIVRDLHSSVRSLFAAESYHRSLLAEIARRYEVPIGNGLQITLNRQPAASHQAQILLGADLLPESEEVSLEAERGQGVTLKLIAGIGPERAPLEDSGWYVYCNGRLVLRADRTAVTGWGTADPDEEGAAVPAWHPQFRRFRGYAFFNSPYPGALPWTTTKNEIDESAEVYRNALERMRRVIRRFTRFTQQLKAEREEFEETPGGSPRPVSDALDRAEFVSVNDAPLGTFSVPQRQRTEPARSRLTTRIAGNVNTERLEKVRKGLRASTNSQVVRVAFDRLHDAEFGSG